MTKEEANELIERMPFINTNDLKITNRKLKLDMYRNIRDKENPVEWVMVIKDEYLRSHDEKAKKYPTQEEKEIAQELKRKLYRVMAHALHINEDDVESYIGKKLAEDW